jgi:putative endonuclease
MPDHRRSLGDFGEQVAAGYLERHGFQIINRKWRCVYGEIDLIARDGATLVFAEVRTRRNMSAAETITATKRRRLRLLAYAYMAEQSAEWRIDAVTVELDLTGRVCRIEHYPNVVEE